MPKKSKTVKSSAHPTERGHDPNVTYAELIAQDPDFRVGSSNFEFPNGDKYEGEFCAHASGLVWRQGKGTYSTKDGQIYIGEWESDRLAENKNVEITYPDESKYWGLLVDSKYSGAGIYQLEEKVSLSCNFNDNKPTEEITLIDPREKLWHGFAEDDESLLIQENPFYRSIGKDLGKGRSKLKTVRESERKAAIEIFEEPKAELKYSDLREVEKEIFAKSKKTPSDLQMESSEWYRDYVTYCDTYEGVVRKAKTLGESFLSSKEYEWYKKYKEFEKKYIATLQEHKSKIKKPKGQVNHDLFQLIHSEKFKTINKPSSIFYSRNEPAAAIL